MRWPPRFATGPAPGRPQPGPPPAEAAPPALFLDRDGVLIVDRDYVADPDAVTLIAGVPAALRQARAAGFLLIGVSNQSGLGRGIFTSEELTAVMRRLDAELAAAGAPLDGFFFCPHAPESGCRCRKPAPGLLEEAAAAFRWDRSRSWVIGDKISDVDLALGAGLRPALVRTGHGEAQAGQLGARQGVLVADDLPAAVAAILAEPAK